MPSYFTLRITPRLNGVQGVRSSDINNYAAITRHSFGTTPVNAGGDSYWSDEVLLVDGFDSGWSVVVD
jgi:hypothetical protein